MMFINLGWWLLPLVITGIAFFAAWDMTPKNQTGMMAGLDGLVLGAFALIVSLMAWLIWAVLT
jgi:UDP-N-acetylmuramyl pentapeptide phosphotransferase/UDP-N-acetylglucosamine-1-phosphate transferase